MYELINVFEVFLPQLLRYPNAADPLNSEAAHLFMQHPANYQAKVKGALDFFFLSSPCGLGLCALFADKYTHSTQTM